MMDGPQLRAAMLRDARLARIPVVVVTAYEPQRAFLFPGSSESR